MTICFFRHAEEILASFPVVFNKTEKLDIALVYATLEVEGAPAGFPAFNFSDTAWLYYLKTLAGTEMYRKNL